MSEIITASMAQKITEQAIELRNSRIDDAIHAIVKKSSAKGLWIGTVYSPSDISAQAISKRAIELGFKTEVNNAMNQRDSSSVTINWSKT